MRILTIPILLFAFSGSAQDFKDFNTAHVGLERTTRYSTKSADAHLSGTVLLSSVILKGELTNTKTLFADSHLLVEDAINSLQRTTGRWKFCRDSTIIVVPYIFYYIVDSDEKTLDNSRIPDDIQTKDVVNATFLPAVVCKVWVSECKMVGRKKQVRISKTIAQRGR